jgi:FkbM family methyltransferase
LIASLNVVTASLKRAYHSIDARTVAQRRVLMRAFAAKTATRSVVNIYYNLLTYSAKGRFHRRYSKIFRLHRVDSDGLWRVNFANQKIVMPIRTSSSWLDWDHAVSIIGHDDEVKETYATLVMSNERPELFLDVGANYGTHSILLLSAGIPVIAFEPNAQCGEIFQTMCQLNGLHGRWEQVAIGNRNGTIELTYPERDTWLGTVSRDHAETLGHYEGLNTCVVPLRTLDAYLDDVNTVKRILIKIDVEGFEREVFQGAARLMADYQPKIIFESADQDTRPELFELLDIRGYAVYSLPWRPTRIEPPLDCDTFRNSTAGNYIAIPRLPR